MGAPLEASGDSGRLWQRGRSVVSIAEAARKYWGPKGAKSDGWGCLRAGHYVILFHRPEVDPPVGSLRPQWMEHGS